MEMSKLRRHYEERFARDDPYDLGCHESRLAIQRGFAGVDLEGRLSQGWQAELSLDVGCGDWGVFYQLPHLVGTRLAVAGDISLRAVQKARQRSLSPSVQFIVFDAQHLPFRTGVFDFIQHFIVIYKHCRHRVIKITL